jgi:uncharacterized protein
MQLVEQSAGGNPVRRIGAGVVTIGETDHRHSVVVSAERVIPGWPVDRVDAIDDAAIAAVLDCGPEVVLLGTGARQVFPAVHVAAAFLTRGIGFEAMDNAAAARTYNVLLAEGRRVVVAFILGDPI